MVHIPGIGGKKVTEEVIIIEGNIDPVTCKEKFKGDIIGGKCMVQVETDPNNPDAARLLRLKLLQQNVQTSTPPRPASEEI